MNCTQCGEPLDGIHILDGCTKRTSEEIIDKAEMVVEDALQAEHEGDVHLYALTAVKALADAGLLARPMDKIALDRLQELAEARGYNRGFHLGWDAALDFTKGKNQ